MMHSGLKADEKVFSALEIPAATVPTCSTSRSAEDHGEQAVGTAPPILRTDLIDAIRSLDCICKVVKIGESLFFLPSSRPNNSNTSLPLFAGAMFSEEAVKMASEILQRDGEDLLSVIDAEAFYKTEPAPPKPQVIAALRKDILPFVTLLSATVPEVMQLLEDAGIPADYPRGIPDVQALAKTLTQNLGPQYVVIKREFIDEDDGATTLHYVLAGGAAGAGPPVMETFRFENPSRLFGASYYIPRKSCGNEHPSIL